MVGTTPHWRIRFAYDALKISDFNLHVYQYKGIGVHATRGDCIRGALLAIFRTVEAPAAAHDSGHS